MDRGDWQATVHGVAKGQTRLSHNETSVSPYLFSFLGLTATLHYYLYFADKETTPEKSGSLPVVTS